MKENIEKEKPDFERQIARNELRIKPAELKIKKRQAQKSRFASPLLITIFTGIISLLVIGPANYLQRGTNVELEQRKTQSSLIRKAVEMAGGKIESKLKSNAASAKFKCADAAFDFRRT